MHKGWSVCILQVACARSSSLQQVDLRDVVDTDIGPYHVLLAVTVHQYAVHMRSVGPEGQSLEDSAQVKFGVSPTFDVAPVHPRCRTRKPLLCPSLVYMTLSWTRIAALRRTERGYCECMSHHIRASLASMKRSCMQQSSEWKRAEESLRSLLLRLVKGDDRIWQPTVTELLTMLKVRSAHLDYRIRPRNTLSCLPPA